MNSEAQEAETLQYSSLALKWKIQIQSVTALYMQIN